MKRIFQVMLLALTAALPARAATTPEQEFWTWFQANESMLFDFERDQERIFDRLQRAMHKVDPDLVFEFGPKQNGKREFVISADGIRAAFPKVEALYAAAPALQNWIIVKYRPRRVPMDIGYGDRKIKAATVMVLLHAQGDKAGITIMIPGYDAAEHDTYRSLAYLFLDQALGEFDVETRVGEIRIVAPAGETSGALSLQELPAAFDRYIAQRTSPHR
ncbi:hypothetical protein [Massilia sp. Mn16-1_5]|uniref:hypothetical protein n=1 Tax=Massilia sp. Mn16-1_5 TaxID=2079199 RepID=UPI00109E7379|nr:hypothetical protein [Massilia sp. Mn16-1_5]THC42778.1 hypothetical protein C2862_14345 [Massilia sp. Mn16-1_5]